jgi:aminopeptidase YwaD
MNTGQQLASAMGHIWTSQQLECDFAALCACGGRFAGTDSETRAREYLAERMAQATGAGVTRHVVQYRGWTRGEARLVMPDGTSVPALGLVRTPVTPSAGVIGPLLDLGRGTSEDIMRAGAAMRGAIVLVRHEFMMGRGHMHRRRKYDAARAAGAAAFVIAYHEPGGLAVTGSSGDGSEGHIPAVGVSLESASRLAACSGQPIAVYTSGRFSDSVAENLIVDIPGTGNDRVVLSAHYDGHDPAVSAIDNASGVIAAITAVEALRDFIPGLPRGLELALFTVEEWALIGSRIYLDEMDAEKRSRIAFNVNLDSVAGDATLTAIAGGFPGVAEFVVRALDRVGLSVAIPPVFMSNSDHANFVRQGIPALRLCAGFNKPNSHLRFLLTAADTPDKVHPHELKTAACVAAALVMAACTDRALPERVTPNEGSRIAGG